MINIPLPSIIYIRKHSRNLRSTINVCFVRKCLLFMSKYLLLIACLVYISKRSFWSALRRTKTSKSYITGQRNIIFISKIPPFVGHVMLRNPPEIAVMTIISTETWQTFFIINPQGVFQISLQ